MRRLLLLIALIAVATATKAQEQPGAFAAFDLAGPAVLNDPHDLAFGPDGRLYVADKFGARIAVLDPETLEVIEIIAAGKLPGVHDISFGPDGRVAVAVTGGNAVVVFRDIGLTSGQPVSILRAPRTEGALVHNNGRIYAMASGVGGLIAYDGNEIVAVAEGLFGAHDVAADRDGNIWVADNMRRRLVQFDPDLKQLKVLDHAKYGFAGPRYLDIDNFGRLIVADQDAHRVLMIDPDGADGGSLLGVIGDGIPGAGPNKFDDPEGVAVRGNQYFFSDSDNNRVVRYSIVTN